MTVSLAYETVEEVVRFAVLTVDRSDEEQHHLLAMAFAADCHHNRATTTNRWFRIGELSDLVGLVDVSRELNPDETRVWLTQRQEATRERQARAWKGETA